VNVSLFKVGVAAFFVVLGAGGAHVPVLESVGLPIADCGTHFHGSAYPGFLTNLNHSQQLSPYSSISAQAAVHPSRQPISSREGTTVEAGTGKRMTGASGDKTAQSRSLPFPASEDPGKKRIVDLSDASRSIHLSGFSTTPSPDWEQMQTAFLGAPDDPEIPIAVLASMVEEDPWSDSLSMEGENPFAHLLQDYAGNETGDNDSTDNADNQEHPDQPADEDPVVDDDSNNDQEDPPDSGNDSGGGNGHNDGDSDDQEPEEKLAEVLFIPDTKFAQFLQMMGSQSSFNNAFLLYKLDDTHFETDTGNVLTIEYSYFINNQMYDEFFLADDLTDDGLTDLLCSSKVNAACSLFMNTHYDFTLTQFFKLSAAPTSLTQLSFFGQGQKQLASYSKQIGAVDFMENIGGLIFQSSLTLPFPSDYDGMASSDFDGDGFDDLIFLNLAGNTVSYLLNIRGISLRPLSQNIPQFPGPELTSFFPTINGSAARLWLLPYTNQTLLYVMRPNKTSAPLASFAPLSRGNCLLIGDFNQDEIVDFAIGRVLQ
jgi:hypothetical protein